MAWRAIAPIVGRLAAASCLLTGCSALVDSSPHACSNGRCQSCIPHRLCEDEESICVEDVETGTAECQPLIDESVACGTVYPPLEEVAEDEIFLIGMFAQRPTDVVRDEDYGGPTTLGIRLAIDEINAGGGVEVAGRRKLLVVECNETPTTVAEQMDSKVRKYLAPRVDHLVEKLRVVAILGPSTSGATGPIHSMHLANTTTLLLSPSATRNELTQVRRPGSDVQLFWRTVPPDSQQIPALLGVLDAVRDALVEDGFSATPSTVSVSDTDNTANEELQNQLTESGGNAMILDYSSGDAASRQDVIDDIKRIKPQIIVPFTTGDFVASILPDLERALAAPDKPWYVMTEGNRTSFAKALSATTESDLPARVIGTAPGPRVLTGEYNRFRRAYTDVHGENIGNLAEFGYDAAYLLAFAISKAATEHASPDGPALAQALRDLSCTDRQPVITLEARGLDYNSRTNDITSTSDGCFDVKGASGPLNYERTGRSNGSYVAEELDGDSSVMAFWCLPAKKDETKNLSYHFEQSGGITPKDPPLSLSDSDWCAKSVSP